MKRTNTVADALNSNIAQIDPGDGLPIIPIPLDGKMPGYPGPPGPGVPEGGTVGQYIEKTSDGSTQWATPSKSKVGLSNVDNTSDVNKPISDATRTALDAKPSRIEVDFSLESKADLVNGKVPAEQIPSDVLVTDANVAQTINGPETGAAIDQRINAQVAPQVEQITADYIAGDQAVIDAAAAAVDANPKISALEASKWFYGNLAANTDLGSTTVLPTGLHTISYSGLGDTILGRPEPLGNNRTGYIESLKSTGSQHIYRFSNLVGVTYRKTLTGTTWSKWEPVEGTIELASGTNLDTLKTPGWYSVTYTTTGNTITGWPTGFGTKTGLIQVRQAFNGAPGFVQIIYPLAASGLWVRTGGAAWNTWVDAAATPPTQVTNPYVGLANSLRVDDFTQRRGGVKKTGGVGAVAFRFDHGLNNFKTEVLPLLQQYGIVGSLALNSRRWTIPESDQVSQAEVDQWVAEGHVEIWNHTATHGDASTSADLYDTIVNGLTELRAQLPSAVIDGFVIPGTGGGTNLGGLDSGVSPEKFFATESGRLILEHHAVTTGSYPGTDRRYLDGRVRQGMGHWTMDSQTSANLISRMNGTVAVKKGQQFMLHPSLLNTSGYMTTADLDAVLSAAAAARDAGTLKIYSPYDLLLADATV